MIRSDLERRAREWIGVALLVPAVDVLVPSLVKLLAEVAAKPEPGELEHARAHVIECAKKLDTSVTPIGITTVITLDRALQRLERAEAVAARALPIEKQGG